jgi:hypothetical protein
MPIVNPHIKIPGSRSGSPAWKPQSSAFFTAAGITDATQKSAIDTFVKRLIAINAVDSSFVDFVTPANSSLKACYIFVGGNATAHKFNLINPADSDVAFRITFAGTIVHDEKGIKPNGTTGYGDTHLSPATVLTSDNHGLDLFLNSMGGTFNTGYELGAGATANQKLVMANLDNGLDTSEFYDKGAFSQFVESGSQYYFNVIGLNQLERIADGVGNVSYYRNGILVKVNTADAAGALPSETLTIGKWNTLFSNKIISYVGIRSKTISSAANILYQTAIYELQNNLSRLPVKNIVYEGMSMMASIVPFDTANLCNIIYAERIFNSINSAVGGSHISDMVTRYSTSVTPYKRSAPFINYLIMWCGINDLRIPHTGAAIWADLLSYANQSIADGWYPIFLTCTKVTAAGWPEVDDAQRVILNNLIRGNCPAGSSFIDLELNVEFADASNTIYFVDGLHMTPAGYMIVANNVKTWFSGNPMSTSAVITDAAPTLVAINFNKNLDTGSVPATTDFAIAGKTITNVSISGVSVTLTVSVGFAYGDTPTVVYTKPGSNYLKISGGTGSVDTFTNVISNNILIIPTVSSAQVTDENKDKVVLTFTAALDATSTPATTDFALAGKTISSVVVSGSTVTITVSVAYANGNTITCDYTSGTTKLKGANGKNVASFSSQAVTNNINDPAIAIINDGNTVGWYLSQDLTTVTKDGSNLVSAWNDKLASGHNLVQAIGTNQPLWSVDGILFDGVDNFMKTGAFTLNQPEFVYAVIKQVAWGSGPYLWDGYGLNGGMIRQSAVPPEIRQYAGAYGPVNNGLAVGSWGIVRALFYGASSKLICNTNSVSGTDIGAGNMGGFTLGASGSNAVFSNIQVKEIILRKVSDSSGDETAIYNYLKNKYVL